MRRLLTGLVTAALVVSSAGVSFSEERPDWLTWQPSPHHSARNASEITAIIVHYTAGASLASTSNWFRNPNAQVSSHYVVGRDGEVLQMVELDRAAWHAGKSEIDGKQGVNSYSTGIEICNWGKLTKTDDGFVTYTGNKYDGPKPFEDSDGVYWEPFTEEQYDAVLKICLDNIGRFPITHITGHSDISIPKGRKTDPGNAFDWERIQNGLKGKYAGQVGPLPRK